MRKIKCNYITGKRCHYVPKGDTRKEIVNGLLEHIFDEHDEITEVVLLRIGEIIESIDKPILYEQDSVKNNR